MNNQTPIGTRQNNPIPPLSWFNPGIVPRTRRRSKPNPDPQLERDIPSPIAEAATITGNRINNIGLIYMFGGFDNSEFQTTTRAYNPDSDSWTLLSPIPIATASAAIAKDSLGRIYVISGYNPSCPATGQPCFLPDVQVYDPYRDAWYPTGSRMPIPTPVLAAAAATGNDSSIYVFGGKTQGGSNLQEVQIFHQDLNGAGRWETQPIPNPSWIG